MTDIILSGCFGKMGRAVTDCVNSRNDCQIVAGVDACSGNADYPVFKSFDEIDIKADAVIDFSHPSVLSGMLDYCRKNNIAAVIGTTGLTDGQKQLIENTSESIPVFFTANMSLGVNLISELAAKAAKVLGNDFDIEIVEAHHNQKIDAPSGTALMLAESVNNALDYEAEYEFDRHSKRAKRAKNEIGIHSVRGGTIVGEHEVIFAGLDEVIKISHSARSKSLFAVGAVNAAVFIAPKNAGLYSMKNLISEM